MFGFGSIIYNFLYAVLVSVFTVEADQSVDVASRVTVSSLAAMAFGSCNDDVV